MGARAKMYSKYLWRYRSNRSSLCQLPQSVEFLRTPYKRSKYLTFWSPTLGASCSGYANPEWRRAGRRDHFPWVKLPY